MKNKSIILIIIIVLVLASIYKFLTRKNGNPDDGYYICNFKRTYEVINIDREFKSISLRNTSTNIEIEKIVMTGNIDFDKNDIVVIEFELIPSKKELDDSNIFNNATILNIEKTDKEIQEPICIAN